LPEGYEESDFDERKKSFDTGSAEVSNKEPEPVVAAVTAEETGPNSEKSDAVTEESEDTAALEKDSEQNTPADDPKKS
jgi:hypothetical protein